MECLVVPSLVVLLSVPYFAVWAAPDGTDKELGHLAGAYRVSTGYVGETLLLNPDGTFEYSGASCTYRFRTMGHWQIVEPNLVKLNSGEIEDPVIAAMDSLSEAVTVRVRDPDGTKLPGVSVEITCADSTQCRGRTDPDGEVTLEACQVVSLSAEMAGFLKTQASIQSETANRFLVTLRVFKPMVLEDQLWYIHDGQIFLLKDPLTRVNDSG